MDIEGPPLDISRLYEFILEDVCNEIGNGTDAMSESPSDKVPHCAFKPCLIILIM